MSKRQYPLTASQPSQIVGLQWEAGLALIYNPTGSPVLLRVGSPEIPNSQNADYIVPANSALTIAVVGKEFGVTFADSTLLSTLTTGNLGSRALIQFQTEDEPVPQFGAASFQSLSTSEVFPLTGFNGAQQLPIIDLGAWGGALIYICATGGSGQGVIQINTSKDGLSFATTPIGTFSFWPNVPAIIQVPRAGRYLSILVNSTAIAGEPAIQYTIGVRTTLAEIQDLVYNVSSQPITKALSLIGIASQQFTFVTVGLPAVSIAAIATAGTTAGAALQFLVEASADLVNWRQVTAREQVMSQGVTLYRSVGQLDLFTRISFFQEVNAQTIIGTAYFSIPPEADLAYILNTIQQSLGDRNQSSASPARADIYHELEAMYQLQNTNLPNILSELVLIYGGSSLNAVVAALNTLATIDTGIHNDTTTITNQNVTIHTDLQTINTDLVNNGTTESSINTQVAAINTNTASLPANIPGIKTDLDNVNTALTRGSTTPAAAGNVTLNTVTNFGGQFTANNYIESVTMTFAASGASPGLLLEMWIGTGGGAVQQIYHAYISNGVPSATGALYFTGPTISYGSIRSPGVFIGANTTMWVRASLTGTIGFTVSQTP